MLLTLKVMHVNVMIDYIITVSKGTTVMLDFYC